MKWWHRLLPHPYLELWVLNRKTGIWFRVKEIRMLIGQKQGYVVTAVNPDGSAAAIMVGTLVVASDSGAVTAAIDGMSVTLDAVSVGTGNVTFSSAGFKPAVVSIIVTDLPQIVVTPAA